MEHRLDLTLVKGLNSWMNRRWCSSKTLLCSSSSFLGAVLAVYYLFPGHCGHQFLTHHQQIPAAIELPAYPCDRKLIILYWTKYFGTADFGFGTGRAPFIECPDRGACLTTTDRSFVNDSDAIIFHARDINVNDLPPDGWRRPHQHYIFLLYESPENTNLDMLRQPLFRHYFNRTMTYRRDSDVFDLHPYGRMECIDAASPSCTEFPRTTQNNIIQADSSTSVPVNVDLTFKNRTIAWFVSNCKTNSRRELLASKLSQFIPVDIYGACKNGNNTCIDRAACDETLSRHYRFYLSFENSLCLDYVTEKLYRPLQFSAVPVVYGGADYSMYLPAGSYVNAMDFDSPEHLADHLNKLMVDDELYLTYFRWKEKYTIKRFPKIGMCQLCRLLGDPETKDKSYADMAGWWAGDVNGTNQICQPSTNFRLKFS
ncbi:hypothetical protein GHT06_010138 [Daphnia sinensis]|uniref:Fucosyltransferase n=1 Tax=Daphnia sinensis TaxID=1820382 RepID=A0AAD5KXP5_9CRUS|nr:hypothetical protein GHT06_010138 [Daphnia sinensis]